MFEKWKPKNSPLLLFSDIRQTRRQINIHANKPFIHSFMAIKQVR